MHFYPISLPLSYHKRFLTLLISLLATPALVGASDPGLPLLSGIDGSEQYSATVCPGSSLCFDLFSRPGTSVSIDKWEGDLPNPLFELLNERGSGGHLCWTASEQDAREVPYQFVVYAHAGDQQSTIAYTIYVPQIRIEAETRSISCHGRRDGQIALHPAEQHTAYFYTWHDGTEDGPVRQGLSAGLYTVEISDATGCSIERSFLLDEPETLEASVNATASDCGKSNGRLAAVIRGGTWPYRYTWNGQAGQEAEIDRLPEGYYTLQAEDVNGCSARSEARVQAGKLALNQGTIVPATCPLSGDGSASVEIQGATGSLQIDWFPYGGDQAVAGALDPGLYTVQVLDEAGCTATREILVGTRNPSPVLALPSDVRLCHGSKVSLAAGDGWKEVRWGDGQTQPSILVERAGLYSVAVTDPYGCAQTGHIQVSAVNCSDARSTRPFDSVLQRVAPNPVSGTAQVQLDREYTQGVRLLLTDLLGRPLQQLSPETGASSVEVDMAAYPAGIYLLTVLQPSGTETVRLIKE